MMQLSLTFADLQDSGTGSSRTSSSHLSLRPRRANGGNNTRLLFDEQDFGHIDAICGRSGLLVSILERQHAAIIARGGRRNLTQTHRGNGGFISVADSQIVERFQRMLGTERANVPLTIDTVKLGDGTLAIYVLFEGGAE